MYIYRILKKKKGMYWIQNIKKYILVIKKDHKYYYTVNYSFLQINWKEGNITNITNIQGINIYM